MLFDWIRSWFWLCEHGEVQSWTLPDELKVARIGLTPIYQSGGKHEFSNYRPISILPICSKFFEKIVHKNFINLLLIMIWFAMFTLVNLVSSTTFSMCCPYKTPRDNWSREIDNGTIRCCICRLKQSIWHCKPYVILIEKLNSFGVTGNRK